MKVVQSTPRTLSCVTINPAQIEGASTFQCFFANGEATITKRSRPWDDTFFKAPWLTSLLLCGLVAGHAMTGSQALAGLYNLCNYAPSNNALAWVTHSRARSSHHRRFRG